jgi:hypothetical protein
MWCVAELDEEYVARMEDVLAVYEKPLSAREPVVCIDEKPVVLHEEVRPPVAMQPGWVARRMPNIGVAERPMFSAASSPRRGGISPRRRTPACDEHPLLARVCRLSAGHCCPLPRGRFHPSGDGQSEFAHAHGGRPTFWCRGRRLTVESVHRALCPQARQLVEPSGDCDRLLSRQCLGQRRIGDRASLRKQTRAWNRRVNRDRLTIQWTFTRKQARKKFGGYKIRRSQY